MANSSASQRYEGEAGRDKDIIQERLTILISLCFTFIAIHVY